MSELDLAIFFFSAAALERDRTPRWRLIRRRQLERECERWWRFGQELVSS